MTTENPQQFADALADMCEKTLTTFNVAFECKIEGAFLELTLINRGIYTRDVMHLEQVERCKCRETMFAMMIRSSLVKNFDLRASRYIAL